MVHHLTEKIPSITTEYLGRKKCARRAHEVPGHPSFFTLSKPIHLAPKLLVQFLTRLVTLL